MRFIHKQILDDASQLSDPFVHLDYEHPNPLNLDLNNLMTYFLF